MGRTPLYFRCSIVALIEALGEPGRKIRNGDAELLHTVAFAHSDSAGFESLEIRRDAVWRTDLVLSTVSATDAPRLIVHGHKTCTQRTLNLAREIDERLFPLQRKDRDLIGRQAMMEPEHDAGVIFIWLFVVRVGQKSEDRSVHAGGWLDHFWANS